MAEKLKGKIYETVVVTDSDTIIIVDKKAQIFYGGNFLTEEGDLSLLAGYGIVEDVATNPDIGGNSYKIGGRVTGLFGAVTTFGEGTKISVGKTAELSAGLGMGAVLSLGDSSTLGGMSLGTVFTGGANSKISIARGAEIGGLLGVVAFGANSSVNNAGDINTGLLGMMGGDISALFDSSDSSKSAADAAAPGIALSNTGSIVAAVGMLGIGGESVTLENGKSGNITAGFAGMGVLSTEGSAATIINAGTVRATSTTIDAALGPVLPIAAAAIFGYAGDETVINTGKIFGNISLGDGDDTIKNSGKIFGQIFGGDGADTLITNRASDVLVETELGGLDVVKASVSYTLSDNVEFLVLTGKADINATGNDGNNGLRGNRGDNILTGGGGQDVFFFGTKGGRDTIADFTSGEDYIDVTEWAGMSQAELASHLTEKGGDIIITLGKDVLIIENVEISQISLSDFVFAT